MNRNDQNSEADTENESRDTTAQLPYQDELERYKPLIMKLYVDEDRKLKDVMVIMKQYGLNPS